MKNFIDTLRLVSQVDNYFLFIVFFSSFVLLVLEILSLGSLIPFISFLSTDGSIPLALDLMLCNMHHGGKISLLGLLPKSTRINWDEIIFKGIKTGEKLYEELLIDNNSKKTSNELIYQSIENKINVVEFEKLYSNIQKAYQQSDSRELIKLLSNTMIGYIDK